MFQTLYSVRIAFVVELIANNKIESYRMHTKGIVTSNFLIEANEDGEIIIVARKVCVGGLYHMVLRANNMDYRCKLILW